MTGPKTGGASRNDGQRLEGSKKCWNCGSTAMAAVDNHFKCGNCKATWNTVTRIGRVEAEDSITFRQGKPRLEPLRRAEFVPISRLSEEF